jgi:LPXTG-motif cell wall-anchored protein
MKKTVSKVAFLLLALLLATGVMAVRAEVLYERDPAEFTTDGDWRLWTPPAGIINDAAYVIIEHTGGDTFPAESLSIANSSAGVGWWTADGDRRTQEPGRIIFSLAGVDGGAVWFGLWEDDNDPYYELLTRVLFVTELPTAAQTTTTPTPTPPTPTTTTTTVNRTNPLTGDSFNPLWLVASGVGLLASLAALFVVFKKKK